MHAYLPAYLLAEEEKREGLNELLSGWIGVIRTSQKSKPENQQGKKFEEKNLITLRIYC